MSSDDFNQLASDAGVPTTEADINAEFDALRIEEGLTITNESAFGPFWRFVTAAATTAAQWLVNFLVTSVLPQAFVKTATGSMLDLHSWAVNISRKAAAVALGEIIFSRADTVGDLVIPEGTEIQSTEINGQVFSLVTVAEVTVADGVASQAVAVQAAEGGSAYNLAENYYTVLVDPITDVTVTNGSGWLTTPGADEETDDDLRERVRNQYSAINQWHTDAVYTAIIASFDGVATSNIYFEHDAPRGPGTANAFVLLETGNPSVPFIASIQSEITDNGNHGHGDDLQVFAMPETDHDLGVTVWFVDTVAPGDKAALLTEVENIVRCAFRENTAYDVTKAQPWDVFSFSTLGDDLHRLVPELKNVAFDLGYIDSSMAIPRLDTLTVAENA